MSVVSGYLFVELNKFVEQKRSFFLFSEETFLLNLFVSRTVSVKKKEI